jgi:hypothetical protein
MQQSPSCEADRSSDNQVITPHFMEPRDSLPNSQKFTTCLYPECDMLYGELLALRPPPKLEDHLLSDVRDCLFNKFVAILHTGRRSSIRNLRMHVAVVTGSHLSRIYQHAFSFMVEYFSTVKMEEASFSEMLVPIQQTVRHNIL